MSEQDDKNELGAFIAYHTEPGWRDLCVATANTNHECVWDSFQELITDVKYNGLCGFSEDMHLADDMGEFKRAATRAGWRIRPVKFVFLDEVEK